MPVKICGVESCQKEFYVDKRHTGEYFRYCPACRPIMKALANRNAVRKSRRQPTEKDKAKMKEHSKRNNAEIKGQGVGYLFRNAPKVKIEKEDQEVPHVLHQARKPLTLTAMTAARYGVSWLFQGEGL